MNGLVNSDRVDIEAALAGRLGDRARVCTIGVGPGVDLALPPVELRSAHVSLVPRRLTIVRIRVVPHEGYRLERGESHFGVYWKRAGAGKAWQTLERGGVAGPLLPGDRVRLGSSPADGIRFRLPELPGELEAGVTTGRVPDDLGRRFRVALHHWSYPTISFGGPAACELHLPDASLAGFAAALHRDLDDPGAGYHVQHLVGPPVLAAGLGPGQPLVPLQVGERRHVPPGARLGFGRFRATLPEPRVPVTRFRGDTPSKEDMMDVLGLDALSLARPEVVKARCRALFRRLHPDRTDGHRGDLSRFLEVRACWEAYSLA